MQREYGRSRKWLPLPELQRKNVWLDALTKTESQIQEKILKRIQMRQRGYSNYARRKIQGVPFINKLWHDWIRVQGTILQSNPLPWVLRQSQISCTKSPKPRWFFWTYRQGLAPRHQYRVVFNEVAEAMQEVTSLHDSMVVLRDEFIGMFGSPQVKIELTPAAGVVIIF